MNQIEINSNSGAILPNFLPQGILLPSDNGIEFSAFTFVPNNLLEAGEVTLGTPECLSHSTKGLEHICLHLFTSGKIESVSDLQGRPVKWSAKNFNISAETTHLLLHVIMDNKTIVSSSLVSIEKTSANKNIEPRTQKLSALEDAINLIGKGGLEPIQLLKKMKDSGF